MMDAQGVLVVIGLVCGIAGLLMWAVSDHPVCLALALVGVALLLLSTVGLPDPDCASQNEPLTCRHYDNDGD